MEECAPGEMQNKWTRFWPEARLSDVACISTACLYQQHEWPSEHLQPVTTIEKITGQAILLSDTKYIKMSERELLKFRFRKGDIVFNHKTSLNHVGKSVIFNLTEPVLHTKYLRIRPFPEMDSQFLHFILNRYRAERRLQNIIKGSVNLSTITLSDLSHIMIPFPPPEIQRQILSESENELTGERLDLSYDATAFYH